jgi:alpha-N-acetylglucosamine transferase
VEAIEHILFDIMLKLLKNDRPKMIQLGFVHFFLRITKRQHTLIGNYIAKNVENVQLKHSYSSQAEFKLNALQMLLIPLDEEIHQTMVVLGFGKYLVEIMLSSQQLLDLRYYKGNPDIVPFRYCNPLRAEAIVMLSVLLPLKDSSLKSDVVSRLIPASIQEKQWLRQVEETP